MVLEPLRLTLEKTAMLLGLTNHRVCVRIDTQILKRACGAAGSALPWHGRGRRFDPDQVHQFSQHITKDESSRKPCL